MKKHSKFLLVLIGILIFLIISQIILSLTSVCKIPNDNNSIYQQSKIENLSFELKPESRLYINKEGFRDDDNFKEEYDIVMMGDSILFGTGIYNNSNIVSEILERKFEESSIQILNSGVPGYNLEQINYYYREKIGKISSKKIILVVSPNDLDPLFIPLSIITKDFLESNTFLHKISKIKFFQCFEKSMVSTKLKVEEENQYSSERYKLYKQINKNSLISLIKAVKEDNKELIIVESPIFEYRHQSELHNFLVEITKEYNITYIDLYPQLQEATNNKIFELMVDLKEVTPIHYNERGHELIADIIYTHIKEDVGKNS